MHDAAFSRSLHNAFLPHGDGLQGSIASIGLCVATKIGKISFEEKVKFKCLTLRSVTLTEGIANKSRHAFTNGDMVSYNAL